MVLPVIFGIEKTSLAEAERAFFKKNPPAGFILFARNIDNPAQLLALCADLKHLAPLIFIDQEGGRVERLGPPHWPKLPAVGDYDRLDEKSAEKACGLHADIISATLAPFGINVNCAPLADRPVAGSHDIIGNRAFSPDTARIITRARLMARHFLTAGILPVVKHVPGHGRAKADSHEALPEIDETADILEKTDFACFKALADLPVMMTAHILYRHYDADLPVTLSKKIISSLIRDYIGFQGLLISDDICMKALSHHQSPGEIARKALEAGCDLILHCNGVIDEMRDIAENNLAFSEKARARLKEACCHIHARQKPGDFSLSASMKALDSLRASGRIKELTP